MRFPRNDTPYIPCGDELSRCLDRTALVSHTRGDVILEYSPPVRLIRSRSSSIAVIVRYYADAEARDWHEYMVTLLERIHDDHGLTVEIDRIEARHGPIHEFPGVINYPTAEEVYERDLKNNRVLIENIDQRPSEAYKRSGNLAVAGHVAIADDGVHWASTLVGDAHGYGPGASTKTAIDFLEDLADSPSERVCVQCLELLAGGGNFCPNCGRELA